MCALHPARASAQPAEASNRDQGFILLVRSAGDEGAVARIRAELLASGFRIVELRRDERLQRLGLADLARKQGATAAVRINAVDSQIELWVQKPDAEAGVFERIVADSPNPDDAVLALRTTEALRAHGLRIEPLVRSESESQPDSSSASENAKKKAAAEAAQTRAANSQRNTDSEKARSAAEARRREAAAASEGYAARKLSFELAPAIVSSTGGLDPALDVWASARVSLLRPWTIGLAALVPTFPQTLRGTEGRAEIWTLLVGPMTDFHLVMSEHWEFSLGAGVLGTMTLMRGEAAGSFVSKRDTVFATAPFGQTALHFVLGERFRVCARGTLGATIPKISVRFGEREAAHWGQPFGSVLLGVEFIALTGK